MSLSSVILPPAILLLGPTASGKTAAALELASRFPIEIISVDSALVYRHMDIGTAKPSVTEQQRCPHHLIDIISPDEAYSAARFRTDAIRLMQDITARGNIPVLAGGTMLYFKALRDGLSDLPQADPALRQNLDLRAAQEGWPALHAELARLDPDAAAQLAPTDAQRIQRALEIVLLTGKPVAAGYARKDDATLPCRLHTIALAPSDRSVLHARIAERFEAMLETGLINEVQALRNRYPLSSDMPSMRCVGYRQVWDYLDGHCSYETLRFNGVVATRQLAKRQLTWQRQFRETWPDFTELDCLHPSLKTVVCDTAHHFLNTSSAITWTQS